MTATNPHTKSDRISSELPYLWISNPIVGQLLSDGFSDIFSPSTPPSRIPSGYHILCFDPDEPEVSRKAIAYDLLKAGCEIDVHQLKSPLAELVKDRETAFELARLVAWARTPYKEWAKGLIGSLDIDEAEELAKLALVKLSGQPRRRELEALRRRADINDYAWRTDHIPALKAEIEQAAGGSNRSERLKLELKALLKESDKIKREMGIASICPRYNLTSSVLRGLLRDVDEESRTRKPRLIGLDELFSMPQTAIEYVIPGMLPVGETVLLVANPKAGKSLLAYDAAFAVATGEDYFLGEPVTKQGKVLIIQCDESLNTARGRLAKRGFGSEDSSNVSVVEAFNINQLDQLDVWLDELRPTLVVIDCLRRINTGRGLSENSAEFADAVYQLKELIARYNAAAILIHHSNKNSEAVGIERVRGSSAIAGAVWGIWQLDQIPKPDPNNKKKLIIDPKDPARILSITARDVEGQRLRIELDPENNHWVNLGEDGADGSNTINDSKTNEDKIIALLKPIAPVGKEAMELNEQLGLGRQIYCYLNRLLGKGIIGSRRSAKDKRRTVYYYPKSTDTETDRKNRSQGEDYRGEGGSYINSYTTPSPPPHSDPNAIEYSEPYTQPDLQNRSQIDRKSIANDFLTPPVNSSNPELVSAPEVDRKNQAQVASQSAIDSFAIDSPAPAVGQWRLVTTPSGRREGKLIERQGNTWLVKVGMNKLTVSLSDIGKLVE